MDNFQAELSEAFNATLGERFTAGALYDPLMDFVEYVNTGELVIAKRVDEFLTLLYDGQQSNVVGFRIKGIRYLFNEYLKAVHDLADDDFLPLVFFIEAALRRSGDAILRDVNRHKAYRIAFRMANRANAGVNDLAFREAA